MAANTYWYKLDPNGRFKDHPEGASINRFKFYPNMWISSSEKLPVESYIERGDILYQTDEQHKEMIRQDSKQSQEPVETPETSKEAAPIKTKKSAVAYILEQHSDKYDEAKLNSMSAKEVVDLATSLRGE